MYSTSKLTAHFAVAVRGKIFPGHSWQFEAWNPNANWRHVSIIVRYVWRSMFSMSLRETYEMACSAHEDLRVQYIHFLFYWRPELDSVVIDKVVWAKVISWLSWEESHGANIYSIITMIPLSHYCIHNYTRTIFLLSQYSIVIWVQ